jgi:hypothetical protein
VPVSPLLRLVSVSTVKIQEISLDRRRSVVIVQKRNASSSCAVSHVHINLLELHGENGEQRGQKNDL